MRGWVARWCALVCLLALVAAHAQAAPNEVAVYEGIGIPPDEVSHLFESLHRASKVGSIPGTGVAIVKNAGGTVFRVTLPG